MRFLFSFFNHRTSVRTSVLALSTIGILTFVGLAYAANQTLREAVLAERKGDCVPAMLFQLSLDFGGFEEMGTGLLDEKTILQIYASEDEVIVFTLTSDGDACVIRKGRNWDGVKLGLPV